MIKLKKVYCKKTFYLHTNYGDDRIFYKGKYYVLEYGEDDFSKNSVYVYCDSQRALGYRFGLRLKTSNNHFYDYFLNYEKTNRKLKLEQLDKKRRHINM